MPDSRTTQNANVGNNFHVGNGDEIGPIREEIDSIDSEIVELLMRRTRLAREIGRVKGRDGKPFFTPERERQIYQRLDELSTGDLQGRQLISIFREIISASRAAEKPMRVAYWGPPGTFSNIAALQTFGASTELIPLDSIEDSFISVERGDSDYAVVPVENSIAGVVPETLDMFPQTNVKICAEQFVSIHHHLVSTQAELSKIERVFAGPQPAMQCRKWLRANLPGATLIEVAPTAKAAYRALDDPHSAAIANKLGAETVGIPIIAEHIHDNPNNVTRFLVIGYNEPARTGRDKTSVMFNLRNKPGELVKALRTLEEENVNLMMIESRPAQRSSFEYIFYVDCNGHRTDENLRNALDKLRHEALETVVLGSYPARDSQIR